QGVFRAIPPGEDVAGRVDSGRSAGFAHEIHDEPARGDVGVRVSDARDAVGECSSPRPAKDAQVFDPIPEARSIDAGRRGCQRQGRCSQE
ncbi:MAG: hypothetical protein ACREAM_14755, partial [Blastocatellia bacterium]